MKQDNADKRDGTAGLLVREGAKKQKNIARELGKDQDFVCLDVMVYAKALIVAREMLLTGKAVKARIFLSGGAQ